MLQPEQSTDSVISSLRDTTLAIATGVRAAIRLARGTTLEHQPTVLTGSGKTGGTINLVQRYHPGEMPGISDAMLLVEFLRDEHFLALKLQTGGHFTAFLDGYFFFSSGVRFPDDPKELHQFASALNAVVKNIDASLDLNMAANGARFRPIPRAAVKDWNQERPVLDMPPSFEERVAILKAFVRE